jgi:hypothetical protein
MRGIKLLTTLMLTIFVAACLAGSPVFSSEHPWDNDNQHPGTTGIPNGSGCDDTLHAKVYLVQGSDCNGRGPQSSTASSLQPVTWTAVIRLGAVVVSQYFGLTGKPASVQVKQSVQMRRSIW